MSSASAAIPIPVNEDLPYYYSMYEPLEDEPQTYTVVAGDNLYRIALKHDIALSTLIEANDITSTMIYPGDVLIIADNGEAVHEEVQVVAQEAAPTQPVQSSDGAEMTVIATAYTAYCKGCSGTTAYGIDLRANPDQKVIAVDPRIIPLGTKVWVEGYGEAIAGDTGGAIKGNKIDVFIPEYENAMQWGVKTVKIKVLN